MTKEKHNLKITNYYKQLFLNFTSFIDNRTMERVLLRIKNQDSSIDAQFRHAKTSNSRSNQYFCRNRVYGTCFDDGTALLALLAALLGLAPIGADDGDPSQSIRHLFLWRLGSSKPKPSRLFEAKP